MAQIYVTNGLVKPKSIHIYNSSAQLWESDRVGYVRVNGEWIPFIEYALWIYKKGTENIELISYGGGGSISRQDERIKLSRQSSSGETGMGTNGRIDVTKYSNVCVEWERLLQGDGDSHLSVLSDKRFPTYDARLVKKGNFDKQISKLDISSLNGEYYIGISQYRSFSGATDIFIYNIWME